MAEIKLTKNELRAQQTRLQQLERYLPTLQLKKAMLQVEVHEARVAISKLEAEFQTIRNRVEGFSALFTKKIAVDFFAVFRVKEVRKEYENIAGVEIPIFKEVVFEELSYNLFETPPWIEGVVAGLRKMKEAQVKVEIAEEKKRALEKELREVSIRVNLFEKVLIPKAMANIKKIKVFLGDQELAAVSQAKVAKKKILERKAKAHEELAHAR